MEMWEILVPATDREGKEIPVEYHQKWDEVVREKTGGLTILRTARGNWLSPDGTLFCERMIPVRIACSKEQIESIADFTAAHYGQLAVMYYLVSSEVVIKNYPDQT